MLLKSILGKTPQFGKSCYFSENATLVGDVILGNNCSVWFNAVIRGDVNYIKIGNNVNIQDGAVVHCTYRKYPTEIGSNVSIGHNALIHGCIIKDNVLVGMGAIIMDNCVVESNVIVAAGAVVTQNSVLEAGYIYAGVPAKKIKPTSKELIDGEIERIAKNYIKYANWYQ
jgi:carbonic anhydrase/acetyltransferase-like protein (isoleucine patch superfamily)